MRLLTGLLLCLSVAASAQDTVSAELVSDPFVDSYEPEVSVSGNVVVGIMTMAVAAAITSDQIAITATADTGGQHLCLKATSRDGIYTSRNVYALPSEAGNVRLPYHSKLANVVDDYGEHEIALSATVGDCDSGASDYFLLGSAADGDTARAVMYVNSFGATDVFVDAGASDYFLLGSSAGGDAGSAVMYVNSFGATDVFVEAGGEIETCEYISEGRRTTFDFICPLAISAGTDAVTVTIIRERFGREQPSISLTVIGAIQ